MKSHDQFQKLTKDPKDKDSFFSRTNQVRFMPMQASVDILCSGLTSLVSVLEHRVSLVVGDLIEPLDTYVSAMHLKSVSKMDKASELLDVYKEFELNHDTCK